MPMIKNLDILTAGEALELYETSYFHVRELDEKKEVEEISRLQALMRAAVRQIRIACADNVKEMYFFYTLIHHYDFAAWRDEPPRPEMSD